MNPIITKNLLILGHKTGTNIAQNCLKRVPRCPKNGATESQRELKKVAMAVARHKTCFPMPAKELLVQIFLQMTPRSQYIA